ncbi:MAG: aromatic ring-hydroxylating dioxygenase subunit alpha [Halioglobus sp.]
MAKLETLYTPGRHSAQSYEDILASDVVPSPDYYREGANPPAALEAYETSRYYDPQFFQKEVDYVWPRIWQWACREEEIPEIGDHVVFDIAGYSFIIVRSSEAEIKAFYNSCLHRGRQLAECDGVGAKVFRCPFHGMAWNVDGSLKVNPFAWDAPQLENCDNSLPEARVSTWGGFVFINMDHEAPSLEEVLGPIPEHFARYALEDRYKAVHVSKKIRANWKATTEAFMETHHVVGTHPQGLPMTADSNTQYDHPSEYVGRQICAHGVQSPHISESLTPQEIFDAFFGSGQHDVDDDSRLLVPEGMSARAYAAQVMREQLSATTGVDYSDAGDAEFTDSLMYNLAPSMSFWGGFYQNTIYRFRPNGLDPESSIMDIVILRPVPKGGPRPKPVPVMHLDFDEPVTLAGETMGEGLAVVFEQDAINLPWVQKGLRASRTGKVEFTNYQEMRLRLHHRLIDRLIAEGEAEASK